MILDFLLLLILGHGTFDKARKIVSNWQAIESV
jgi:hypothetical protein